MRYWHYTFFNNFQKIIESKEIRQSTILTSDKEKPAVWLSSNPEWEETVRKALKKPDEDNGRMTEPLSRDELFKRGFPAVRIEIDPRLVILHSWEEFKKVGGLSKKMANGLEKVGKSWGANPDEWWASFDVIPVTSCLLPIEIWSGKEWVDIEEAFTKDEDLKD